MMLRSRQWLLSAGLLLVALPASAEDKKPAPAFNSQADAINHYIRDGYTKAKIAAPAGKATDSEFLRRAFIDLVGRVATLEETLDFINDQSQNKRAKLVQRLINDTKYKPRINGQFIKAEEGKGDLVFNYSDEFGEHWANIWTVWLMTRSGHYVYRDQMRAALEKMFIVDNKNYKQMVEHLLTVTGKSNVDGTVNFIIHHLGEATPKDKDGEVGPFDAIPITSRVTRLFLGIQTNCTQCHDHPFNKEWVQSDFWGVNAYFRQTLRDKTPTGGMERRGMENPVQVELRDDPKYNNQQIIYYERRDGKLMASKPNFLKDLATADSGEASRKPLPVTSGKNRREVMAEYVTGHDNFAKAYVNRVWGHFFGRGLNKEPSIDDFGSHNEVIHPELLDYLAAEFVKYDYDPKKLMEWICTSEVYNLSHVANVVYTPSHGAKPAYVDAKYDAYFARMPLKALSPEVLYASLKTVMKTENLSQDRDQRQRNRQSFVQKLVQNFGDDEGNEMTFNGTVVQALLMMNGQELNNEITRKTAANPVNKIIAKHSKGGTIKSDAVIEELFLTALNRKPTTADTQKIHAIMNRSATIAGEAPAPKADAKPATPPTRPMAKGQGPKGKNAPPAAAPVPAGPRIVPASGPNDPTFYQDLFWALLNTNEFMLNH